MRLRLSNSEFQTLVGALADAGHWQELKFDQTFRLSDSKEAKQTRDRILKIRRQLSDLGVKVITQGVQHGKTEVQPADQGPETGQG